MTNHEACVCGDCVCKDCGHGVYLEQRISELGVGRGYRCFYCGHVFCGECAELHFESDLDIA